MEALAKRMVSDFPFCMVAEAQHLLPSTLNHLEETSEQLNILIEKSAASTGNRKYFTVHVVGR
jgi:hypothetical protein